MRIIVVQIKEYDFKIKSKIHNHSDFISYNQISDTTINTKIYKIVALKKTGKRFNYLERIQIEKLIFLK